MNFVREHINFERNINPKAAVNIGAVKVIDEKIKELLIDDGNEEIIILSINFYEGEAAEFVCDDLDGAYSEVGYVKGMITKFGLDPFFDISKLDNRGFKNGVVSIVIPLQEYFQGLITNRIYLYNPNKEEIEIKIPGGIKENLEFERGQDPKKALGLGNEAYRVASDIGIDMPELRSLWNYIAKLEPETETGEDTDEGDFQNHLWMLWDDPAAWGIEKDSSFYEAIDWAYKYQDEAWRIYNLTKNEVFEIYENLEFERGKDPREALGLGGWKILKKQLLDLLNSDWRQKRCIIGIEIGKSEKFITLSFTDNLKPPKVYVRKLLKETGLSKYINLKAWDSHSIPIIKYYLSYEIKPEYEYMFKPYTFSSSHQWMDQNTPAFIETDKSITEALDFERGKDPKTSMNIGAVKILDKKWDELQQAPGTGSMNLDYQGDRLFLIIHFGHFPGSATENLESLKKYMGMEYFDWNKSYQNIPNNYFCIKPESEDLFIKMFNTKFSDWPVKNRKRIGEALDFERGKDPRSALRLGKLQQIYKGMFEDNWSHDEDINDALQWSSFHGNLENVMFLLELGADPAEEESMAFMEAIKENHYNVADIFVDRDLIDPVKLIRFFKQFPEDYQSEHIMQYIKDKMSRDLRKNNANESLEFERGKSPKEALNIGSGKLIPENWEHLKRDLRPYLNDYSWEEDEDGIIYLDIEDRMDAKDEAIPIINGYLETWAEVEDYEWFPNVELIKYTIKIKEDYINIFKKTLRDEMPY